MLSKLKEHTHQSTTNIWTSSERAKAVVYQSVNYKNNHELSGGLVLVFRNFITIKNMAKKKIPATIPVDRSFKSNFIRVRILNVDFYLRSRKTAQRYRLQLQKRKTKEE